MMEADFGLCGFGACCPVWRCRSAANSAIVLPPDRNVEGLVCDPPVLALDEEEEEAPVPVLELPVPVQWKLTPSGELVSLAAFLDTPAARISASDELASEFKVLREEPGALRTLRDSPPTLGSVDWPWLADPAGW